MHCSLVNSWRSNSAVVERKYRPVDTWHACILRLMYPPPHGGEVTVRSLRGSTGLLLAPVAFCKSFMCAPAEILKSQRQEEKAQCIHVRAYRKKNSEILKSQRPATFTKLSYCII